MDFHCSQGYCSSNNTTFSKVKTQRITIKNPRPKASKPKKIKPACAKTAEFLEPKVKKKKTKEYRQDATKKRKEIPATGNNTINTSKIQKSIIPLRSYIFTEIKKVTILALASNLQKSSVSLNNPRAGD